jgi:hypothetical protein
MELEKLKQKETAAKFNILINSAYAPLTLHWSFEQSRFPEMGVGICGTIAAMAQLITTWNSRLYIE